MTSDRHPGCPAKFIIFDTKFLVFDTKFLVFDTKFLVFEIQNSSFLKYKIPHSLLTRLLGGRVCLCCGQRGLCQFAFLADSEDHEGVVEDTPEQRQLSPEGD